MNPFDLDDDAGYQRWCDEKLATSPATLDELIVEVNRLASPSRAEIEQIQHGCARTNMAIFATRDTAGVDKAVLRDFAARFGLNRLNHNEGADDDGVTALSVVEPEQWRKVYIPYTNRPISWHTDGYYNTEEQQIRGLMLYCETPAFEGGENALLDHELAYIHLRDTDPAFIHALMRPDAMTIPANEVDDHIERPDRPGPVFSVTHADDAQGHSRPRLHMRYTARGRNVVWRDDPDTSAARQCLSEFLHSDNPAIFRATLESGQGLICNNVLHDRSGFNDSDTQKRLLYRLRFFDRITVA